MFVAMEKGHGLERAVRPQRVAVGAVREQGVSDPSEVAKVYIEPDGQVTVLKRKQT